MDEALHLLDPLLDGVTGTPSATLMVLLGLLEDTDQSEDICRAAGELRFRIGSRRA